MVKKYPLLLEPVIKDYLWGGTKLLDQFGFKSDLQKAAEGWMLSLHKDGTNTVLNGEFKGKLLSDVLAEFGESNESFPLLIKLIDAKDKLSVQVHPSDEYAFKNEGEPGKTEVWYVVDCEPNSQLVFGFNKTITKAEFKERIEQNALSEVLNFVPVKKGDVFFIKSGTLHAIGGGILIAEIQQNSNTTYRVSDYGRLGSDGKPRALHIDKALDVTDLKKSNEYCQSFTEQKTDFGSIKPIAECEYFKAEVLNLKGKAEFYSKAFISLLVLEGEAAIEYADGTLNIKKGDSVFIPSDFKCCVYGNATIIKSTK